MSKKLKSHQLTVEPVLSIDSEEAVTELVPGKLLIANIPSGVEPEMLGLFIDRALGLEVEKGYTLELKLPKAQMLLSSARSENGESVYIQSMLIGGNY